MMPFVYVPRRARCLGRRARVCIAGTFLVLLVINVSTRCVLATASGKILCLGVAVVWMIAAVEIMA